MNPCAYLCSSFWGLYCCCHCSLFAWDIIDENFNAGEHINNCYNDVVYKCGDYYKKIKRKKGYDRVELVVEEKEPEIGSDKEFHIKFDKPMRTLYEISYE